MHRGLIVLLVLWMSAPPAAAQVARPLAVTVQRATLRSSSDSPATRRASPDIAEGRHGSVWPWVGVGVLGGALAGGGVAAAQVARTDDAFFPGLAVGAGVVVGALAGGLVGALIYVVTHQ